MSKFSREDPLLWLHHQKNALLVELEEASMRAKVSLQQNSHIKGGNHDADDTSSTPDMDLSRTIPSLQKRIEKFSDIIKAVENGGKYGICEECEEEISDGRLKAVPFAKLCINCKNAEENQRKRNNIHRSAQLVFA